eukprot:762851-Hanusia_phi.AAC.1
MVEKEQGQDCSISLPAHDDTQKDIEANEIVEDARNAERNAPELNEQQKEAAFHAVDIPLLILAGAGSGKTKTLVCRIKHLVYQPFVYWDIQHCSGKRIEAEIDQMYSRSPLQFVVMTILMPHRRKAEENYYSGNHGVQVIEDVDRDNGGDLVVLLEELIASSSKMKQAINSNKENKTLQASDEGDPSSKWIDMPKPDKQRVKKLCQAVSLAQAQGKDGEQLGEEIKFLLEFYEKTLVEQTNCFGRSTDLMLSLMTDGSQGGEAKKFFHGMYRAVLVDEFQDTSRSQFEFVKQLVSDGKITAVGDDDQ